jgi:hypothetical protein
LYRLLFCSWQGHVADQVLLDGTALHLQVPPVPSQLVRTLTDVLWAAAELREVLHVDVTPELWQVLLNHAQPEWVVPPSSSTTTTTLQPAGSALPWLQHAGSSPGRFGTMLPSAGSSGVEGGSTAAGSAGGASDGSGCAVGGVHVEVFSMVQAYGEWYVQVSRQS